MSPLNYPAADGLYIGPRRRGMTLKLGPDGQLSAIPCAVDRSEILDCKVSNAIPDSDPIDAQTRAIAGTLLAIAPSSIAALFFDRHGALIATTVTRYQRFTRGPIVHAIRSAPYRAKSIVLAASQSLTPELRDAATSAADALCLSIKDFLTIGD